MLAWEGQNFTTTTTRHAYTLPTPLEIDAASSRNGQNVLALKNEALSNMSCIILQHRSWNGKLHIFHRFYFIGQEDTSIVFTPSLAKITNKQNSLTLYHSNICLWVYIKFQWCKTCPRQPNIPRGLSMKSPPNSFCYLSFLCNTFSTLDVNLAIRDLILYFIYPVTISIWNLHS